MLNAKSLWIMKTAADPISLGSTDMDFLTLKHLMSSP